MFKVKVKSLSNVQLFATHGLQPTKLLRPWNSPGKNTGVGCHFFLQFFWGAVLNQIPYDYTVEVRNRFKGLDLNDRVPDELWNDIVQETGIKTIPTEKKCKNAKWLSRKALQIPVKRREVKNKEKRKDISI